MRYENDEGLWLEVPDKWTATHYAVYNAAYITYLQQFDPEELVQLWQPQCAGALALIAAGFVTSNIPGLDDPENFSFEGDTLEMIGLLISLIAEPITQAVKTPFGLSRRSSSGTIRAKGQKDAN